MRKLKELLLMEQEGWKELKKAIVACTITNLLELFPFAVVLQVFVELLKPFTGGEVAWERLWMLFIIGCAAAVMLFFSHKNDYKKTYVASYSQSETNRLNVAGHMRRLPMSYFNSRDLSALTANMMNDCTNIEQMMSSVIPQLISNIISITVICIMLAFFDWRMALAMFLMLPFSLLTVWLSRKAQSHQFAKHADAKLAASQRTQEYIDGMKVIKSCGLDGEKYGALDDSLKKMRDIAMKVQLVSSTFTSLAAMILQAGIGITVYIATMLLTEGQLAFLPMLMFLLMVVRIYAPILTVLTLLPDLLYVSVSTKRLRSILAAPPMNGKKTEFSDYAIRFEHVTFSYGGKDVIHNLTAEIPAEKVTAIVGPSGSGKSTLSKLAARFWDVHKGEVYFGGKNVKGIDPDALMQNISFVFQDVTLFQDTIINNIRVGNEQATEEEVMRAAQLAYCDEFISELPNGYHTVIGENGSTLSGGQRQRISIARALLKDAPVIMLDEATASLDPESEVFVQQAISHLTAGKTVVVIAHRLRTVLDADNILVLDNGTLKEQGTHESLMEQGGLYKKLFVLQQESFDWSV